MLEITQAHLLLQIIRRFKEELALLEHEVYATLPSKKKTVSLLLTDPKTGKPFEKKTRIPNRQSNKTK